MKIVIKDELLNGKSFYETELSFPGDTITLKELISERVRTEVEDHNKQQRTWFSGLVEPCDTEKTLNVTKTTAEKLLDAEKHIYIALDAFQRNGFFVLVDGRQVNALHDPIELRAATVISFVKITPLVGG